MLAALVALAVRYPRPEEESAQEPRAARQTGLKPVHKMRMTCRDEADELHQRGLDGGWRGHSVHLKRHSGLENSAMTGRALGDEMIRDEHGRVARCGVYCFE